MRKKPVSELTEKTDTVCLADWAQAYLDFAKVKFSDGTYNEKKTMFRSFFKEVKPGLPVTALKPAKVLAYVTKQKEARSGYAANKDRKNLVAAWNWGMKYMDPLLQAPNPCMVDRMPEIRQPRYIPPEDDFWKVYDTAEGQDKVLLLAFLHLAPRRGEIFKLTWDDVDFINSRIRLKTQKRRDGTLEYDWLPMTGELRKALRWWWENRPIKESKYVFLCLEENHTAREFYGKPFKFRLKFMWRICERAGVRHFGFHAIRHLSASLLYNLGYEVAVIQMILRHKNPTTTEGYLRSLGLEKVRAALENLPHQKGKVLSFPEGGQHAIQKQN
jgi:integrase